MSNASLQVAGILLVLVVTVEFGGYSLIQFLTRKTEGYLDNPVRQAFFRAGHAHAGVLVILSLVSMLYVDQADLSDGWRRLARSLIPLAAILMPAGFFFSMIRPSDTRPNAAIWLIYLGALSLAAGTMTLGIGLLRAS